MAYMDDWASIQREHESALYVTVNDLVTRSVLLPIIGGVNVKVCHFLKGFLDHLKYCF